MESHACSCQTNRIAPDVAAVIAELEAEEVRTAAAVKPFSEPFPVPEHPPAEWFDAPDWVEGWRREHGLGPSLDPTTGLRKITVTDEGRVGGYFYEAGQCIVHMPDACPGPSPTRYAAFHQGDVVTAGGTVMLCGVIGNTHGHASPFVDWQQAQAHYADPSAQMIICRAGDDEVGGWIAGALVPGLTHGDVALIRRCGLSGDWRPMPKSWWQAHGVTAAAVRQAEGYDCIGPTLVTRPALPLVQTFQIPGARAAAILGGAGGVQLEGPLGQPRDDHGRFVSRTAAGTYDEAAHPRGEHGRWGDKGGGAYVPKGRTDEQSADYTDDPRQLAQKFDRQELEMARDDATTAGKDHAMLKFDYEEWVPLEAVEEAIPLSSPGPSHLYGGVTAAAGPYPLEDPDEQARAVTAAPGDSGFDESKVKRDTHGRFSIKEELAEVAQVVRDEGATVTDTDITDALDNAEGGVGTLAVGGQDVQVTTPALEQMLSETTAGTQGPEEPPGTPEPAYPSETEALHAWMDEHRDIPRGAEEQAAFERTIADGPGGARRGDALVVAKDGGALMGIQFEGGGSHAYGYKTYPAPAGTELRYVGQQPVSPGGAARMMTPKFEMDTPDGAVTGQWSEDSYGSVDPSWFRRADERNAAARAAANYDEAQHPRGEHGRWGDKGGAPAAEPAKRQTFNWKLTENTAALMHDAVNAVTRRGYNTMEEERAGEDINAKLKAGSVQLTRDEAATVLDGLHELLDGMSDPEFDIPGEDETPPDEAAAFHEISDLAYKVQQSLARPAATAGLEARTAADREYERDYHGRFGHGENPNPAPDAAGGDQGANLAERFYRGEPVTLPVEDVATFTDRLAELTKDAKPGEEYNLCEVSVPGTNLFCGESQGIERQEMPQFSGKPTDAGAAEFTPNAKGEIDVTDAFVNSLRDRGVSMSEERIPAAKLKATQNELDGAKVSGMTAAAEAGKYDPTKDPIIVSKDNYVVDGHHRWASAVALDSVDGRLGDDSSMPVIRVDMPISELIPASKDFADKYVQPKSVAVAALLAAQGDPQPLRDWFNEGADGQIQWGESGSFEACVRIAGDHMDEEQAKGFCAERHHDATGHWPGEKKAAMAAAAASELRSVAQELAIGQRRFGESPGKLMSALLKAAAQVDRGDDKKARGHLADAVKAARAMEKRHPQQLAGLGDRIEGLAGDDAEPAGSARAVTAAATVTVTELLDESGAIMGTRIETPDGTVLETGDGVGGVTRRQTRTSAAARQARLRPQVREAASPAVALDDETAEPMPDSETGPDEPVTRKEFDELSSRVDACEAALQGQMMAAIASILDEDHDLPAR